MVVLTTKAPNKAMMGPLEAILNPANAQNRTQNRSTLANPKTTRASIWMRRRRLKSLRLPNTRNSRAKLPLMLNRINLSNLMMKRRIYRTRLRD